MGITSKWYKTILQEIYLLINRNKSKQVEEEDGRAHDVRDNSYKYYTISAYPKIINNSVGDKIIAVFHR